MGPDVGGIDAIAFAVILRARASERVLEVAGEARQFSGLRCNASCALVGPCVWRRSNEYRSRNVVGIC